MFVRSSILRLPFAGRASALRPSGALFRQFSANSADGSHDDFKPKLKPQAGGEESDALAVIKKQVAENPIMLYMKGTPSQPQCGFSMQAVRILNACGVDFASVNVLQYPAIREGVKQFSDWPTIPQLYVKGEFVGGCDIMTSMYKEGELQNKFKEMGLVAKV